MDFALWNIYSGSMNCSLCSRRFWVCEATMFMVKWTLALLGMREVQRRTCFIKLPGWYGGVGENFVILVHRHQRSTQGKRVNACKVTHDLVLNLVC